MLLTDFLDNHGVPYRRHGENRHVSEGWVGMNCPQCEPHGGNYKLGVNLATLAMTCWSCGPLNRVEALASLSGLGAKDVREGLKLVDRQAKVRKGAGRLKMPDGLGPLLPVHKTYLRQERGFDPAEVERVWKVQATGQVSELPWHLILPVYEGKDVVSWTARKIRDDGRRYYTAPDERSIIPIKQTLYGEQYAAVSVLVLEGPLDVWAAGPGAVCTYGVGYTPAQLLRLTRYAKRVVAFDSDVAGRRRAASLCAALSQYDGETVNVLLDSKDVASASEKDKRLLRQEIGR